MTCNTFIFRIIFGILVSFKITLFKDLVVKIINADVAENGFFLHFPVTLNPIISRIKSLNKFILDDYDNDKPNRIVQINGLHVIYNIIDI